MSIRLKQSDILATFDKLVEEGEILYGPATITRIVDDGFPFEFHSCPALQAKPLRPEDEAGGEDTNAKYDHNATFGPGSDIKRGPPEFLITEVNKTHNFVFNKFCVYRAQYMLLTADSYHRQDELLSIVDLKAAWAILEAFEVDHYLFYNCTSDSGNSREHKHMQVFEKPLSDDANGGKGFELFPDSTDANLKVPFQFFVERFDGKEATSGELLAVYERLIVKARLALELEEGAKRCPHNMILVKEWMMVVPRRKALVGETTVSAAGMMGLVWANSDESVDEWKSLGPTKILAEVGVPI